MYHITFATPSASNQWRKELSERIDARNRSLEDHTEAFPVFPTASFPWRQSAAVQFHSPGSEYFEAVADAIAAARHCVFIADWWLSPQIYLKRRELPPNPAWRLDNLLQHVAQKGVKVYVIFYKETPGTLQTNSAKSEKLLKGLHSNINVLRHGPGYMNLYWSHHQKFVCVDYHTAFVGGIDLCFGRYETTDMPLGDADVPHRFIGVDYYNPSYHGCVNDELCDAFHDRPELDRNRIPRMPWQDVAVSFGGEAAYDVAMGFIQRWNNHTAFQSATDIRDIQAFPKPLAVTHSGPTEHFSIRVVRSIAEVSCRSAAPFCYSRYNIHYI
jgi:phospholipase D1/2